MRLLRCPASGRCRCSGTACRRASGECHAHARAATPAAATAPAGAFLLETDCVELPLAAPAAVPHRRSVMTRQHPLCMLLGAWGSTALQHCTPMLPATCAWAAAPAVHRAGGSLHDDHRAMLPRCGLPGRPSCSPPTCMHAHHRREWCPALLALLTWNSCDIAASHHALAPPLQGDPRPPLRVVQQQGRLQRGAVQEAGARAAWAPEGCLPGCQGVLCCAVPSLPRQAACSVRTRRVSCTPAQRPPAAGLPQRQAPA